jgi:hypothetical protein
MLRNIFIVLVLAALAGTSATASPVRLAKAHKRVPVPAAGHTKSRRASTHNYRHVPARTPGRTVSRTPSRIPGRIQPHAAPYHYRHAVVSRSVNRRSYHATGHYPLPPAGEISSLAAAPVVAESVSLRQHAIAMPAPLKGSFESLARQNERAEADGLERILDEDDLNDRIAHKLLVPVPASASLLVNGNLPENHRYCRPWTANFLNDLSRAHEVQFHRPIEVSSAVRTVEYQQRLMLTNGNAAPAEGDIVSPHLTGGTIDIVKQGMTRQELGWMRGWLLSLQLAGTIDVEEEFRQACFHITVYRNYAPPPPPVPVSKPRRRHRAPSVEIASRGR